ncbi:unnamed protein product [Calicophoron daubneyi]|uniref:POU-specific domain-containing protein n=1 Tax=Calicophoron daubneyi TaxID=300641 RepID=A0AAV2TP20_CALDB
MKSNCLAETLVPFSGNQATFQHYLVFQNEDHCQVYVPITVLNAKQLEPRHESLILKDLKRKMKITFRHEVPEVSPFSKPGAKFFLKPRSPWSYKSAMKPAYKTRSALRPHPSGMELPSTSWVDTNSAKSAGLSDLQSFVRTFVAKRAELNMGQKDVAKSLKVLYGVHRSSSMISRVERMDLTVSNFLQIYPVLVQWLKDTEDVQSREAIIRAAIDPPTEQKPRKALVTEMACLSRLTSVVFSCTRKTAFKCIRKVAY